MATSDARRRHPVILAHSVRGWRTVATRGRQSAARVLFRRACRLSQIAKVARSRKRAMCAGKAAALIRAHRLAPRLFRVSIDGDYQIGHPVLEFLPTGERLHIPWGVVPTLDAQLADSTSEGPLHAV